MATAEARNGDIVHIPFASEELRLQRSSGLLATDRVSAGRETWSRREVPEHILAADLMTLFGRIATGMSFPFGVLFRY
jgi:hypothetical protein